MSMMKIEVVPDPSVTTGGHAIIRLRGVAILPPGATLRIDPIDESLADEEGWPNGEFTPLDSRQTPDGLELRVGPDIVDAPLLEPGVPVTITVSEADLSGELVWPDLPISSSPTLAPVVMSASQMAAEFAAAERAKADAKRLLSVTQTKLDHDRSDAAVVAKRDASVAAAIAAAVKAPVPTTISTHPAIEPMTGAVLALDKMLANGRSKDVNGEAPRKPVEMLSTLPDAKPKTANGATETLASSSTLPVGPALFVGPGHSVGQPISIDRSVSSISGAAVKPLTLEPAAAGPDTLSSLATKRAPDPTPVDGRPTPASAVDGTLPTILLKQATEAAAARTAILEPVPQSDVPPQRGSGIAAFFAGAALAAASLLLAVFAAPIIGIGAPPAAAPPRTVIADAFMAGPQSPRGEIATNIDLPTALRLADYNLHGVDRAIDRAEAEFWLKKAMSLTASHTQLRWAVTQLGTLAAQPVTGSPDYDKARLLWEISAGNGDPIALCFLGTLAENGLGGPADRAKALEYYKRSKEIGGCPSTDEAITRLSK